MPEVDGLELSNRISTDPRFGDLQVVLLSSIDSTLDERRAAGVHAHLRKPVRQSQLYDGLMSLLMPDRPDASAPRSTARLGTTEDTGTVLLVEDNPANQLVGARILEKIGHSVDVVSDGSEALDALGRRRYDAVLMDCQMPVMDGYEATRRLRRREVGGRRTPVIAMTAGVTIEDRHRCLEAGMDDFLPKPVRPEAIAATLGRWMRTTVSTVQVGPSTHAGEPTPSPRDETIDPERWEMVLELVGDDPAVLDELVTAFATDVPAQIDRLREAMATRNLEAARGASHRIKGSAMNLGAAHLADTARQLEQRAREGTITAAADLLDQLDQQAERAIIELRGRAGQ